MTFRELLIQAVGSLLPLNDDDVARLEAHHAVLEKWNRRLNLTSMRGPEEIVIRHYGESLFLASKLPGDAVSVVDVGSGGGFPGIPIAVVRPDCRVTLVESHQRKAVFLKEATRGWGNVRVLPIRGEAVREQFDWMVSRAVHWSELPLLGKHIGLLVGEEDARKAQIPGVKWTDPERMPWGDRRVLLIGEQDVPRGTA